MNIGIFTEGSKKKGFGHIMRCSALYDAWIERNIEPTLIVHGDDSVKPYISKKKHVIGNWIDDSSLRNSYIKKYTLSFIDSYIAPKDVYSDIADRSSTAIYIDDNNRLIYPKGVILNTNAYAETLVFPQTPDREYILGPSYVMLRKEFWDIPKKQKSSKIASVMITFGGEDMRNMTPQMMDLITNSFSNIHQYVIIGKGYSEKNISAIEKRKNNNVTSIYYPDAKRMIETMMKSDIAISAGGQTLYELIAFQIPTIAIPVIENQIQNVDYLSKKGLIDCPGNWSEKNLLSNINKAILLYTRKQKTLKNNEYNLVNNQGARKVVKRILSTYINKNISIRRCEKKDIEGLYQLSNSPEVREHSFNKKNIPYEEHKAWFNKIIADNQCVFLVADLDNKIIGQARANIQGSQATISISISPAYHGMNIGSKLLEKMHVELKEQKVKVIHAYVKKTNDKSVVFFQKLGYTHKKETQIKGVSSVLLIKKL
jgi:spore coat polysaccharide biosynthesis predicted glycosyltransferase SpsG/L-amino acid N-acyltransferase YncA